MGKKKQREGRKGEGERERMNFLVKKWAVPPVIFHLYLQFSSSVVN